MKILKATGLFIPPAYQGSYPPLGTAALVGFLREKGLRAFQGDLNISFLDYIKRNKLEKILTPEYRAEKIRKGVYYYKILQYQGISQSLSYEFENIPGSSYAFTERILSSRHLLCYLGDEKENFFVNFFHQEVSPRIQKEQYDLVGFSITGPSQVVASFTFGYLIKRFFPRIKIVIGGQWVSFFREEIQKKAILKNFFDFAIFFEGETPLYKLIQSLQKGSGLSRVPNLIFRNQGKWEWSDQVSEEDMDSLPAPDFDGLPLNKYAGSKKGISLTFETARGCYWNRCVFCVDLPLPKPRYREKDPDLVIRDMKHLIKKYGVKHLMISNPTFSPWQMKKITRRMLQGKIQLSWWAMARLDNEFDMETLRLAKKSGCMMMGFGVESMNQRVLDFLEKGTKVNVIRRIVKDAHDLNLPIYFQMMLGLPSETQEEALDTLGFLINNPDALEREPVFNIYYLIPHNKVFLSPGKYGIIIKKCLPLPFRFFYPFEHVTGKVDLGNAQKLIRFYEVARQRKRLKHFQNPQGSEYLLV